MKNNRTMNILHFLSFIRSKHHTLYQEFQKNLELQELMQPTKVHTFFQPILSLNNGSTVGFEVLNRPESTCLFPTTEQFYDYVGKSNESFKVECFLRNLSLERFAHQVKESDGHHKQLVFVNIQTQVLADPSYRSGITLELLARHHLSPKQIVLELTEKESVTNYEQFEKMIQHYREQGFRIAIDDAGTGYNSLKTLVYLKPEFIKIDKSLIRNIHKHSEKQHLVELLFEFASQENTEIIAEGIETIEELIFLKNLGIHMGQGYALGKPKSILLDGHLPEDNLHIRSQLA